MFLPGHHLSTDDKDVVRLGTGLIGTIAALVLGLLIASAKGSYDTQSTQVTQMTSNVFLLDNLLAQYGPETNDVRNLLRRGIVVLADRMWREKSSEVAKASPFEASAASDAFFAKLQQLSPQNDSQRSLQARAIQIATDIAQTRLLLFAQTNNSIPMPFLVVLIFWLTIIFGSFGLFAKPSATVFGSLFVFALSVAGGDLPSPGTGSAICGVDANFQRATAQRPHAAQSLSHSRDRGCRPEQAPTAIAVVATDAAYARRTASYCQPGCH